MAGTPKSRNRGERPATGATPETPAGRSTGETVGTLGGVAGELVALTGDSSAGRSNPPKIEPNRPYVMQYHPARWTVGNGVCFPQVGHFRLQPGENNVTIGKDSSGKDVIAWKKAAAGREDAGWHTIPDSWGPGGKSYLKAIPLAVGRYYATVWETLFPGSANIRTDAKGYAEWLCELVDSGRLPPARLDAIEKLIEQWEKKAGKARDVALREPSRVGEVTAAEANLAALRDRLAKTIAALEADADRDHAADDDIPIEDD